MPYATASDTARLYYEVRGEGDPLLLITGLGMSLVSWHRNLSDLAGRFRVIAFDNRGAGLSDNPGGPYTTRQMARDALAVLDALGVEAAHVLGVSIGGLIAQEFAIDFPSRVRRLILACAYAGGARDVQPESRVAEPVFQRNWGTFEQALRGSAPFVYASRTVEDHGELIEEDIARRLPWPPSGRSFRRRLDACYAHNSWDRLHLITAPTLVVHGEADQLVPTPNARLIAGRIPGAKLAIVPGAAHMVFSEAAAAFNEAVTSFLVGGSQVDRRPDRSDSSAAKSRAVGLKGRRRRPPVRRREIPWHKEHRNGLWQTKSYWQER